VIYYLHSDHLGSTSLATTAGGAIVPGSRTGYDPYGAVRYGGALPTDFTFTGQRAEGFGLYDYHARWYAPALGRFISANPLVPEPGNPQALNRYAYVNNNPLRYADPSGHYVDEGNFWLQPGCSYDPGQAYYLLWAAGGTVRVDTYFLSPAASKAIFGVAVPQRVAVGTVVAVNDPGNKGPLLMALAGGLTGMVANLPMPQFSTQIHAPTSQLPDIYGDPGPGPVAAQTGAKQLPAPGQSSFSQKYPVLRHYTDVPGAITNDRVIRLGSEGKIWLTPDKYTSASEAQKALAVDKNLRGYFEIPIERIKGPLVGPNPVQGGTGQEFITTSPIDVSDLGWIPLSP
jgi:RHS repeat-associated protein